MNTKPQTIQPANSVGAKIKGALHHAGMVVRKDFKKNKYIYLMLLPVVAYFIIFHYIPMLSAQIAFRDYNITKGIWGSEWVGLKHFKSYFNSYYFGRLIRNTLILSAQNICLVSRPLLFWQS